MSLTIPPISDLPAELTSLLRQVPRGRVTTYGALAEALGNKAAARWVGEWMADHVHTASCNCHRVVRKTGELGLYVSPETDEKARRLTREGIAVNDGHVDLGICGWNEFTTDRPLARLVEFQERLPERVRLRPFTRISELAAGLDVSYAADGRGVAAYALVEVATKQLVWSHMVEQAVTFPYISGMLAFRELQLHVELLKQVGDAGRMAPLLFVDGHGRLHSRRAGIATHLGVLAGVPTIGVGKKLLCGQVALDRVAPGAPQLVVHAGEPVGMAVRATAASRPIFVSPGQKIDIAGAVRMTELLFGGHRVPEPIYHADALSRRAARSQ